MDGNSTQIIYQAKCDLESLTLIRFMQHQEKPTRSRFWKDFFSSQDLSSVESNRKYTYLYTKLVNPGPAGIFIAGGKCQEFPPVMEIHAVMIQHQRSGPN